MPPTVTVTFKADVAVTSNKSLFCLLEASLCTFHPHPEHFKGAKSPSHDEMLGSHLTLTEAGTDSLTSEPGCSSHLPSSYN